MASGPNAAQPHAHAGERVLTAGDLVVLDFGGVYGGYCVDLTRTVAVGKPDAEMQRVYDAVLEAQNAAIAVVRAGVRAGDIDAAARQALAGTIWPKAFGHSTGHGLGVEIHEAPRVGPRTGSCRRCAGAPGRAIEAGDGVHHRAGRLLPGLGRRSHRRRRAGDADGVEMLTNVPRELEPVDDAQHAWNLTS